jgi:protein-glutamine gamma-glutamyltransferase
MEQLTHILSASITLVAALSGLVFAAAEGTPLAALTLPIGTIAWYGIDRHQRAGLPKWAANIGACAALAGAIYELTTGSIEARLLSGGHLLIYLTWLFLLQRKSPRAVWWLTALSVLQVAVASVLTSAPWFGVALFGWLLLAMWTLAVFTMQRAVAATQTRSVSPLPETRVPIPQARAAATRSYAVAGLRLDDRFRLLSGRFVGAVSVMTLCGLVMSMLFFLLIPRVWMSRLRFFDDSALRSIGAAPFTDQIRLGDIGEIMTRHQVALEAAFFEHPTSRRMAAGEASLWTGESPLFRAKTLESYKNGRWDAQGSRPLRNAPEPPVRPLMRVDLTLHSVGSRTLLTIGLPVSATTAVDGATIDRRALTNEYVRTDDGPTDRFRYSLYSEPEPQSDMVSRPGSGAGISRQIHETDRHVYEPSLLQIPRGMRTVVRMTEEALRDLPPTATNREKAQRLESFLRDSGLFEYSVHPNVSDRSIDPLEDFLANRRSGHCEYFASALTLMLRAANIKSRLVTGFKGGDWDEHSGGLIVLERHAHAWAEALVEDGWMTLDATPAERDVAIDLLAASSKSLFESINEFMLSLWSGGITMNGMQQREMVYRPIADFATVVWASLLDVRGTVASFGSFVSDVLRNPSKWISWRGGITVFTLLASLVLLIRFVIRRVSRLRSWRRDEQGQTDQRLLISFYQSFREIVARAGVVPHSTQTAAEFGQTVEETLGGVLRADGLSGFPESLSRDYYRVRFGGEALEPNDEALIERRLGELEHCLSRTTGVNLSGHDLRAR